MTEVAHYVRRGVDELQQDRLPQLIAPKCHSQMEGIEVLGGTDKARATFIQFQKQLYRKEAEHAYVFAESLLRKVAESVKKGD